MAKTAATAKKVATKPKKAIAKKKKKTPVPKKSISTKYVPTKTVLRKKAVPKRKDPTVSTVVEKFRTFISQTSWPLQIRDDGSAVVFRTASIALNVEVSNIDGRIQITDPTIGGAHQRDIKTSIIEMQRLTAPRITFQLCMLYGDRPMRLRIVSDDTKKSLVIYAGKKAGAHVLQVKTSGTTVVY